MDINEPATPREMIKIKIEYAGICGTDLHMYLGELDIATPGVAGHEFSGTIFEIGEGVSGFMIGDKVAVEHTYETCGICFNCKQGHYQLCKNRKSIGFDKQGAFAEYVIVNPKYIHKLPDNVELREGAMLEPLACAVHGVELINPQVGTRCLIIGPGPIGILTAATLKAYGCKVDMIGTEQDFDRLKIARQKYGINIIISEEINDTEEYDLVVDCSGSEKGIETALNAIRKGGDLLQIGLTSKPITINYDKIAMKEIKIQGSFCHNYQSWERAIYLISNNLVDLKSILTEETSIESWKEAFEKLIKRDAVKIIFKF